MQGWVVLMIDQGAPVESALEHAISVPALGETLEIVLEQVRGAYPKHVVIGALPRRQMLGFVSQIDELASQHGLEIR